MKETEGRWKEFIEGLIRCRDLWEKLMEDNLRLLPGEKDNLEPATQKGLSLFGKIEFHKLMLKFIPFVRASGGLEIYLPEEKEEEEEEEVKLPMRRKSKPRGE